MRLCRSVSTPQRSQAILLCKVLPRDNEQWNRTDFKLIYRSEVKSVEDFDPKGLKYYMYLKLLASVLGYNRLIRYRIIGRIR